MAITAGRAAAAERAAAMESFGLLINELTGKIAGRALDGALEEELNTLAPAGGSLYARIVEACRAGIAEGWMCEREAGGIKYGRVLKATPNTHDFSIDLVDMRDVVGPHHKHPNGEIDLVMPLEGDALFDGRPAGWTVYPSGSAHRPTVTNGRALVLYLLPKGAIEFTGN